ncbi:MAG: Hsp70 family protein [Myxococcales bacterium]|nr:Hsp70 family protein [Myxococcales bacterium]
MARATPGIDFGTTNSALALLDDGALRLAQHLADDGGRTSTFRSVLHFVGRGDVVAGPTAIARYLAADGEGRLIQSLKSHLASEIRGTVVLGKTYSLEELAAILARALRVSSERELGPLGRRAVVGRPVRFVGASNDADDAKAAARLRAAFALAGFDEVTFAYEPVGAAYHYESTLSHDERVLIGDFGGGTSDFCLIDVGPGARARRRDDPHYGIVGTEGVGLAGDALDGELVGHIVAPVLGQGSHYRSYMNQRDIAVPPWIYEKLKKWHHLSFLKAPDTMRFLQEIRAQSLQPEAIEALLHVVESDLGYHIARSVEATKVALSNAATAPLRFVDDPVHIEADIARADFEHWVAPRLDAIAQSVDRLLEKTATSAGDVDRVFLTGGTSLVPAVRSLFERRFGAAKVRTGDALTSVALGLARIAADLYGPLVA